LIVPPSNVFVRWSDATLLGMADESVQRVLMYRLGSLGDHLVALPSYRLVQRAFPAAECRLLTNLPVSTKAAPAAQVLEGSGLVQGYIGYSVGTRNAWELFKLWRQIRRWRPQVLVYLAGARGEKAARRDARFFKLCGIKRQIGVPLTEAMQLNHFGQTAAEAGVDSELEPEAARIARNLAELGDARLEDAASWGLGLTAAEMQAAAAAIGDDALGIPAVAMSVGTKVQANDWGKENWRALLARVAKQSPGRALLLVGAAEESNASELAASDWKANGGGPVVNLCGKLTPRESGAAIARTSIFLGHDSGPMHLAVAVGTPCVAVFSARGLPRQWWPMGARHRVVHHRVDCQGCKLDTCIVQAKKCIVSITVDEVIGAVEQSMRSNLG
jgi:ADP-heptose:LPS heptosyltransferase